MNLDSTLAVTKTCPKDGVHLSDRQIPRFMITSGSGWLAYVAWDYTT